MFNIDKKKFGAFVAALRKEKGITQKELSEQLCISDKAISCLLYTSPPAMQLPAWNE